MMLIISQGLLWLIVLTLAAAVIALVRQVGVLHGRISPVGALSIGRGPRAGEAAPLVNAHTMDGAPLRIGDVAKSPRLLFFVSPTCPICKSLLPTVKSAAADDGIELTLVGDGDPVELTALGHRFGIGPGQIANSMEIGRAFHVGKLPYAVLLDGAGVISSQGLVNSREHVESLFIAHERKLPSIQAYLHVEAQTGHREGATAD